MEDGSPSEAILLLAWPLCIIGLVTAGVLAIFPCTRKAAGIMAVIVVLGICGVMLAGQASGRKRVKVDTTEQGQGECLLWRKRKVRKD